MPSGSFLLLVLLLSLSACQTGTPPSQPSPTGWRAGAASRSVLPTVNGSREYADPGVLPFDLDATSPGVFVEAFDQGPIHVGNGNPDAHWVRDDLRVRALALQREGDARVAVIVAADLYMLFAPDVAQLRRRVAERLPEPMRAHVDVLVAASHNHHGPDTAFEVNAAWFDMMLDEARDAVVDAVERLEPATLRAAEGTHYFGASDLSGIRVYDPTLGVLQARAPDGRVIATLVQWANHPESTLNWSPPRAHIADDCSARGWTEAECDAAGRYLTADFPGALARSLGARIGGEVLYVNGAIGAMASPLGVPVWEVDARAPIGNHYTPPAGARPPGGEGTDYTARNFRKAFLIGQQLGRAVETLAVDAIDLAPTRLTIRTEPFLTRITNIGFRKRGVIDATTGRPGLGFMPRALYTCPGGLPAARGTCTDDGGSTGLDPVVGEIRRGTHVESAVTLLEIADVSLLFLPGEVPGELVAGLPADVKAHPERWQDASPEHHVSPATLEIPGYVKRVMPGRFRWVAGLGNDELGYVLPLSDVRIRCVADQLGAPGACARLHAAGLIDFPDALSGAQCKALIDGRDGPPGRPDVAELGRLGEPSLPITSCLYGQALGQAQGHYEETNSAGWDLAQDVFDAVVRLTGTRDTTAVNPALAGYWHGHPPD